MHRLIAYTGVAAGAVATIAAGLYSAQSIRVPQPMSGVIVSRSSADLQVRAQAADAGEIAVDRALVPSGAWLVVRTAGDTDTPGVRLPADSMGAAVASGPDDGKVLGMVHLPAGESRDVIVPLDPTVRRGPTVRVVLQADRGLAGTFEFDMSRYAESPDKPFFLAPRQAGAPAEELAVEVELR